MTESNVRWLVSSMICLLLAMAARADLALPGPFSDHMVLQQEMPVPIWGFADPGETVTVRIAGQEHQAAANEAGRWRTELDPLSAGGPHALEVSASDEAVTFQDVLVGQVWLCGGQSNMEWPVAQSDGAGAAVEDARERGRIRVLNVPNLGFDQPLDQVSAQWTPITPENVGGVSAVAYHFATRLQDELGVPIGLVEVNWGGTRVEPWMLASSYRELDGVEPSREQYRRQRENIDQQQRRELYLQAVSQWLRDPQALAELAAAANRAADNPPEAQPTFDDADWQTATMPASFDAIGFHRDGVVWFRRTVAIPPAWAGQDLTLTLGPIDDRDTTFFDGRRIGQTSRWNQPRIYTVPGKQVHPGPAVITIRVRDVGGPGGMRNPDQPLRLAPSNPASVGGPDEIDLRGPWKFFAPRELELTSVLNAQGRPAAGGGFPMPGWLNNAMIAPVAPYAVRGAIWYQGEANVGQPAVYDTLFARMIRDWRHQFQQPDLPFYYVQIAPYNYGDPDAIAAAVLRESQRHVMAMLDHVGMVTVTDIAGDGSDIHPRNKTDVGHRLARWAFADVYGHDVVRHGPHPSNIRVDGDQAIITFDLDGGAFDTSVDSLSGFTLAGPDGAFHAATATFGPGENEITVTSPRVDRPAAVRFGYANNPQGLNLRNTQGLPATPFELRR